jgi:hypothetical protein
MFRPLQETDYGFSREHVYFGKFEFVVQPFTKLKRAGKGTSLLLEAGNVY